MCQHQYGYLRNIILFKIIKLYSSIHWWLFIQGCLQSKVVGVYTRQNIYAHVTTVTHICYVHINVCMVAMEVMVIQRKLVMYNRIFAMLFICYNTCS